MKLWIWPVSISYNKHGSTPTTNSHVNKNVEPCVRYLHYYTGHSISTDTVSGFLLLLWDDVSWRYISSSRQPAVSLIASIILIEFEPSFVHGGNTMCMRKTERDQLQPNLPFSSSQLPPPSISRFNTVRPRQNGRHLFVPKGPINNIPALVQMMAWRRSGDKPSEPMVT